MKEITQLYLDRCNSLRARIRVQQFLNDAAVIDSEIRERDGFCCKSRLVKKYRNRVAVVVRVKPSRVHHYVSHGVVMGIQNEQGRAFGKLLLRARV